jgi:hypothetical protein
MPGARGKVEIKLVLPPDLKAQLDAEAQARGMDRSALICAQLLAFAEGSQESDGEAIQRRLDQVLRDHVALREQLTQVITLIETFMAAVGKPHAPAEKGYPQPASWEETYPELYETPTPEPTPPAETPQAPTKRWGLWPR